MFDSNVLNFFYIEYVGRKFIRLAPIIVKHVPTKKLFVPCVEKSCSIPKIINKVPLRTNVYITRFNVYKKCTFRA